MQLLANLLCGCMLILQACKMARGAAIPPTIVLPPADANGFGQCYDRTLDQTFNKQRKSLLKQEILFRLHLESSTPEDPPDDLMISAEDLASYTAAVALEKTISVEENAQERVENCREKDTFYAKRIMLFVPSIFEGDVPSVDIFDWELMNSIKRVKREDMKEDDSAKSSPTAEKDTYDAKFTTTTSASPNTENEPTTASPTKKLLFHHQGDSFSAEQKQLQELLTPIEYELNFSDIRSSLPAHTPIWSASLQLYKRKVIYDSPLVKREANPTENIEIYWMSTAVNEDGAIVEHPVLVKSQDVWTEDDEYVSFDITEGLRAWLSDGLNERLDLKVVIRCPESVSTGLIFLPSVQFDTRNKGLHEANLVVKVLVNSDQGNRTKRETTRGSNREYCLENPDEIHCCLKETTINIKEDLGLTWVLAPKTFQFTYCMGLCPRIWPSSTLNFEYLGRFRATNPTAAPKPCCVPHDTRPLTVLTYEEGKLAVKQLAGMIVDSCQCR